MLSVVVPAAVISILNLVGLPIFIQYFEVVVVVVPPLVVAAVTSQE